MGNPNLVRKTVDPTSSASGGEITSLSEILPPGTVLDTAATTAPSGWLLCYGQAISRTTYSALFSAIGTTYGAGDGSTTFNLPDTRGRARAGKDNMGGSAASRLTSANGLDGTTLGASGGAQTHTLTEAQMPSHTHTQTAHQHIGYNTSSGGSGLSASWSSATASSSSGSYSGAAIAPAIQSAGSSAAHNNTQPTIIFNTIIKY